MKRTKNLDLQDLTSLRATLRRRIDAFKIQEKDALCSVWPYFILYKMSFDRCTYKDHYEKFTNVHDEVGNLEHTDILVLQVHPVVKVVALL